MENPKTKNEELNRLSPEKFRDSEKVPIIVVLDNVRSLNNVGSVFRTADAFRIEAIHLCGHTGTPPNKEISKTALGATDTVEWKYFSSTKDSVSWLRENNYIICSVEQTKNSMMLNQFSLGINEKIALVFGNEVYGVEQEIINLSDCYIEIPQLGYKHSLNISVSAGIVLWELSKKFLGSMKNQ
jgi:23S rRNA (guanosine2251-2'-O)-methyltransferase